MRVSQSQNSAVQGSEAQASKKTSKAQTAEQAEAAKQAARAEAAGSAKSEISSKGKEMAKAKSVASNSPDIREEKIAELKRRIAAGKYSVDADAVADRMVDDHLSAGIG